MLACPLEDELTPFDPGDQFLAGVHAQVAANFSRNHDAALRAQTKRRWLSHNGHIMAHEDEIGHVGKNLADAPWT